MGGRSRMLCTRLMCGVAAISLGFTGAAVAAEAKFSIQPQPLTSALNAFSEQSQLRILFKSDMADAKVSPGISGVAEPEVALGQILSGTGLSYHRAGETYVIIREGDAADPQAAGAGGGADTNVVQELVVTAQKKSENIQVVPIAISAFTQQDLTTRQIAGGPDLMTQVPNMTFTKTNFSGYSIQIRGIGTQAISATTDAAVAVAFNNTPFIRNRFFEQEFYDLERVEVLRGPQGTLYGRNATAGVVNILSAKPTFDYQERLSADVANYGSKRVEGMVNIPLVDDKVGLRLAGAWTKRDGFDTNEITGDSIDGRDLWSTRLSLRFEPTDRFSANLIWEHFQENDDRLRSGKQLCHRDDRTEIDGYQVPPGAGYGSGSPAGLFNQGCLPASLYSPDSYQAPNGFSLPYYYPLAAVYVPVALAYPYAKDTQSHDLRTIESTIDPQYKAKTDTAEIQLRLDLGHGLTLTSESGYLSDALFAMEDYNRFATAHGAFYPLGSGGGFYRAGVEDNGVYCDPQIGCADRLVAMDLSTAKSRQFSQEFRLSSDYDGPFNFSLGANFLRYDTEDKYYVFINTVGLYAAMSPYGWDGATPPPYESGSDNHECMRKGFRAPDPSVPQNIGGCIYIDPNPIGSLNDLGHNYFLSKNPYKLISYALFGETYYNITPTLKLTAGLRFTIDKKEAPRIPSWLLAANTVGYPVAEVVRQEWREPTGRLAIDWRPELGFTGQTLLYASYARGYKAGGANPPSAAVVAYGGEASQGLVAQSATNPKTFEPEFVNAFEIGTKNTLLDGTLTLNADAFYYDYTGYQISYIVDRSAVNLNFDAKIWGIEFEGDWRPLRNLRLGLKVGYESTRMADGSKAIDVMDRTAGHTDWMVARPFPTYPSNCIVPVYTAGGPNMTLAVPQNTQQNGNPGYCEFAYVEGFDPVTRLPYVPNPTTTYNGDSVAAYIPNYIGFDPKTAPNNGEGFYKDLSGNELPNAPHYTATLTTDYTIPLPMDWLVTLHSDLYYQSEAWTRVFNTPGYDRLKAYSNVNVAAIFTNEAAGLKVMAYVKNVFDRDSITGAFLNSDDTGLTTNVFLTEPRLYGLRVTKAWTWTPGWAAAAAGHAHPAGEPYPLTVEFGGQVQRHHAPYETIGSDLAADFSSTLNPLSPQHGDLDWGDGREVELTYQPAGSAWTVSGGVRVGRTNGRLSRVRHEESAGPPVCPAGPVYAPLVCEPDGPFYRPDIFTKVVNWADGSAQSLEQHTIVDFAVGRDMGFGKRDRDKSIVALGVRYAHFVSKTNAAFDGIPDWDVPNGWGKYDSTSNLHDAAVAANRKFSGAGPTLSWEASRRLLGNEQTGHIDANWSLTGGVLFGKQKTTIEGSDLVGHFSGYYTAAVPQTYSRVPVDVRRSKSVSVPLVDLSAGVSYEIGRLKLNTGYRWERYFNAIDGGYAEHRSYDRTIDGPYFKVSVGFGG